MNKQFFDQVSNDKNELEIDITEAVLSFEHKHPYFIVSSIIKVESPGYGNKSSALTGFNIKIEVR